MSDLPTIPASFGQVQGRCPACGYASLFLGAGGYVTCGSLSCPRPDAASVLLEGRYNLLNEIREAVEKHGDRAAIHAMNAVLHGSNR